MYARIKWQEKNLRQLNRKFKTCLHKGEVREKARPRDSSFISIPGYNARASGFCLVGDSGMGKTSTINHTLALYPQVLFHQAYHNMPFHNVQLVWMRLECPMDASVKGLCSEFFMELDRITGDNTFAKFASGGRATTDQMIPQMAMIIWGASLGRYFFECNTYRLSSIITVPIRWSDADV